MPYALRETVNAFRRSPVLTALSAALIGLSLFVVGLFGIAAHNVRLALDRVEAKVEIVAYLRDDAPPEAVRLAQSEIAAFPETAEVLYISREHALEVARRELGELRAVFADLETNPLPASLEIRLQPGQRGPQAVEAVAGRIAGYPFVEEVGFGREWIDKIFLLRRIAGAAALVLGAVFAAVAALIIGAAVRMSVFARRDEISIMRLVGATNAFVSRPFLLEGLFTGLLGALVALGLTRLVYDLLSRAVFQLEWLPDLWVLAGIGAGILLGGLASAVAVRRHLRAI
jgi:cell division transport system permease protein